MTLNPFRPRRIRIVEAGWETYSDVFGNIQFKDGVSVDPVPWQEQQRLGGILRMESAEDDDAAQQIGPAAELIRVRDVNADDARVANVDKAVVLADGEARLAAASYTREELEDIADRKGIAGLRDIAAAWNVKGRSINELIGEILQAQDSGQAG